MDKVKDIRNKLEGPALLRYAGAIGGATMTLLAAWSMLHIMKQLERPNALIIKCYAAMSGLAIVCVELKNVEQLAELRKFFYKWFPFLGIMAGKGVFYIFAGCLSLAFIEDLWMLAPGAIVASIGVLYLLMHFGQCKQLAQAIEEQDQLQIYNTSTV